MTSLGKEFKAAREAKGFSLKEISETSRISLRYLEAIEKDELDTLPGGFFVKGMIRNYAKAVGLDSEEMVEKYRRAGILNSSPEDQSDLVRPAPRFSAKQARSAAILISILLIGITFAVFFLTRKKGIPEKTAADTPVISTAPAGTPEKPPATDVKTPVSKNEKPAPAPENEKTAQGLVMELSFTGETWIQVYADGALVVDGVKRPGFKARVTANREFILNLGNAGGFQSTINGKPVKSFGRPGAVVKNVRITPETLTQFLQNEGPGHE